MTRVLTTLWVVFVAFGSLGHAASAPTGKYKTIIDKMQALVAKYPQYASVFSIGQNDEGTELMALRISITPSEVDHKKIGHLVVATHHGNEGACAPFTLYYAEELLKKYSSTELFRGNLSDIEWTLIPVLNVTGYNANSRYENGRDPNRDYPGVCNSNPGGKLKSIRTFMEHLKTRVYSGSLTVHGYVGSFTYPWGIDADNVHTQDHNLFETVTAKAAAVNGYRYGTSTDIVYPADNTYEDFAYWKYGMWSLLLEMKDGSQKDIEQTSLASFLYFDQLAASPSLKNQFTGHCQKQRRPDLRLE